MKPAVRNSVASVAISTIGSFLGKYGVLETTAREMTRASPGAVPRLSRALASRYFARYDSSRSRCAFASRSSARSSTSCPLVEAACRLRGSRAPAALPPASGPPHPPVLPVGGARLPLALIEAARERFEPGARHARVDFVR